MAHWGFLFGNLLIAWIMKVTLFDFIRGTTEDTSRAYWATPQRAGRWAHLIELNFEVLHCTVSHFLLETQENLPTNVEMPTACLGINTDGRVTVLPQRPLSRPGFAQILPLLLPQFVAIFFFPQNETHQSSFHLSVLLLKLWALNCERGIINRKTSTF